MTIDLDALEKLADEAGGVAWHAGHFSRDDHPCECVYIFDDGHAGAVASVHVDNGLPISSGGNDAPQRELAKANQRFIAAANPATIKALIAELKEARALLERTWPYTNTLAVGAYDLHSDIRAFLARNGKGEG